MQFQQFDGFIKSQIEEARRDARPSLLRQRVLWGSNEGKRLIEEAEEKKKKGNDAVKQRHYELAFGFYSEAFNGATLVSNNEEQLAAIHSNSSFVLSNMGKFEDALELANSCIILRPSWSKGYFRKIRALVGLEKYDKAFDIGVNIPMCNDLPFAEKVDIFVEALLLLPKLKDFSLLDRADIDAAMWDEALTGLLKQKAWQSVGVLFMGNDQRGPVLKNRKPKNFDLSSLLEGCSVDEWTGCGQKLAVTLLQKGAKMETLDPHKKHGLHAALKMGIKTETYELLEHLFLRHIPMADRDRMDDEGNTLLHVACRDYFPKRLRVVQELLKHNVGPHCKNKNGRRALELIKPSDPDFAQITKAMADNASCTNVGQERKQEEPGLENGTDLTKLQNTGTTSSQPYDVSKHQTTIRSFDIIANWSDKDVKHWAAENSMNDALQGLQGMDGKQLMELRIMQTTSPQIFYQMLHDNMKLSFVQILKLSGALRKLA